MFLEMDIPGAGPINIANGQAGATIEIPVATEHVIYRERALKYPRFWNNLLGLYQFVDMEGRQTKNISDFDMPEYNLSELEAGCVWEPTTGVETSSTKVTSKTVKYQNEQCADAFWSPGWKALLGKGLGAYDLNSTEGAQKLISVAIDKQHNSIGNDYWKQIEFGGHPMIDLADQNGWWANSNMKIETWERLKKQQKVFGGHVTMMDGLQAQGELDNFSIPINEADVDGAKYTGDAFALLDEARERLPEKLALSDVRVWKMTPSVFHRLKAQLSQRHRGTNQSYTIDTLGHDGSSTPINVDSRYMFQLDGDWFLNCPEWNWLDKVTGTKSHRIGCFAPGVFIVPYDVSPSAQFEGMGMRVHYSMLPKDFGKTYMWGAFDTGAALLGQRDYMAYGSLTLKPS